MLEDYTALLDTWTTQIQERISEQERRVRWDGMIYNGGTALALLCTSAVALWSSHPQTYIWAPRALSVAATFRLDLSELRATERVTGFIWK
jgi:hypothetical protein